MGQEEVLGVWRGGHVRAQKGEVPPLNVLCLSSLPLSHHHSHSSNKKKIESGVSERGGYVFFFVSVTSRHTDWEKYIMG